VGAPAGQPLDDEYRVEHLGVRRRHAREVPLDDRHVCHDRLGGRHEDVKRPDLDVCAQPGLRALGGRRLLAPEGAAHRDVAGRGLQRAHHLGREDPSRASA
jgi:hypothetical protein